MSPLFSAKRRACKCPMRGYRVPQHQPGCINYERPTAPDPRSPVRDESKGATTRIGRARGLVCKARAELVAEIEDGGPGTVSGRGSLEDIVDGLEQVVKMLGDLETTTGQARTE